MKANLKIIHIPSPWRIFFGWSFPGTNPSL